MKLYLTALLSLLLTFPAGGHSTPAAGVGADETERVFKEYGFPAHKGLSHLCRQRVYGSGREITWDAFASTLAPAQLVKYYRGKLGDAGFERDGEGGLWRMPEDAPHPSRVLSIMPVSTDGPFRQCEKSPPAGSKSIIMVSRMT
jgi:hypothetical protein